MSTNNIPNQVVVNEAVANIVTVNQDAPNLVTVVVASPGMASSRTRRHVHTQNTPSTSWTITHSLGGRPQVTVVDTGENVVHGDVQYLSDTQIVCSFSSAFSGLAYLT